MLVEAALFLATKAVAPSTSSQAIRSSVGLWARARRCSAAWAEHERRSQAAMHKAIDSVERRRTVVVLGSGLLRDVPIERLSSMFRQVVLIDICHLACTRAWLALRRFPNVELRTADVSGYDKLAEQSRIRLATGQDDLGVRFDPLGFLRRIPDVDLVISANLLSQIGIGAAARYDADPRQALMPDDTVVRIIAGHLDSLTNMTCKTCLVTDVSYVRVSAGGDILEEEDLLHGVEPPLPVDEWQWPVAPFGEEAADYQRVHRVIAIEDVAVEL